MTHLSMPQLLTLQALVHEHRMGPHDALDLVLTEREFISHFGGDKFECANAVWGRREERWRDV